MPIPDYDVPLDGDSKPSSGASHLGGMRTGNAVPTSPVGFLYGLPAGSVVAMQGPRFPLIVVLNDGLQAFGHRPDDVTQQAIAKLEQETERRLQAEQRARDAEAVAATSRADASSEHSAVRAAKLHAAAADTLAEQYKNLAAQQRVALEALVADAKQKQLKAEEDLEGYKKQAEEDFRAYRRKAEEDLQGEKKKTKFATGIACLAGGVLFCVGLVQLGPKLLLVPPVVVVITALSRLLSGDVR